MEEFGKHILETVGQRAKRTMLDPINQMVDEQITDMATTVGAFVIRSIRGKMQRTITFTVGTNYADAWMEEALLGILYEYNDIKKRPMLELQNKKNFDDGSAMVYALSDGTHNLKYRKWDILLNIATKSNTSMNGRTSLVRTYTVICYDLSPEFVKYFESDMIKHRNSILQIKKDSPFISVYQDYHEADGYTYWDKSSSIPKRGLNTIYMPEKQKRLLINTIDGWFAAKKAYRKHGIPWNLKILLYGPAGTGKSSLVKAIASHWNRNIYEISGGKNGKFIPNAITSTAPIVVSPLCSISDMDKYPMVISEPDIDMNKEGSKEESIAWKQTFNNMINALDGILSPEGRIIVITTNHIEKFSDTILRPGRIDLKMEIGYVTPEVFKEYVKNFYNVELPGDIELKSDKLTVAEMQPDIMFYKLSAKEFIDKYCKVK